MIILMFIIIISIIVLVRVFPRSRGKDANVTMPFDPSKRSDGYPPDDPYITDPSFSVFAENSAHFIFWDRPDN